MRVQRCCCASGERRRGLQQRRTGAQGAEPQRPKSRAALQEARRGAHPPAQAAARRHRIQESRL